MVLKWIVISWHEQMTKFVHIFFSEMSWTPNVFLSQTWKDNLEKVVCAYSLIHDQWSSFQLSYVFFEGTVYVQGSFPRKPLLMILSRTCHFRVTWLVLCVSGAVIRYWDKSSLRWKCLLWSAQRHSLSRWGHQNRGPWSNCCSWILN